jgi:hypothetical protein
MYVDKTEEKLRLGMGVSSQGATKLTKRGRGNGGRPEDGVNAAARAPKISKDSRIGPRASLPKEAKSAACDLHLHDNAEALGRAAKANKEAEKSNKDSTAAAIGSPSPKSLK